MELQDLRALLAAVAAGALSPEQAELRLRQAPFVRGGASHETASATVDLHRSIRQGVAEIIYGAGKTAEQIAEIAAALRGNGQSRVLITRLPKEKAAHLPADLLYDETGQIGLLGEMPEPDGDGEILVATGGTSDLPVAAEAVFTARVLGNRVTLLQDVGVSGLHRLLSHLDEIMSARVIIAIAGMEGALASVIGGLAAAPVIAVPTSVGYGASFHGLTALLSMLNSCASGVSVVNIDNGFGAAYQASMINHVGGRKLK